MAMNKQFVALALVGGAGYFLYKNGYLNGLGIGPNNQTVIQGNGGTVTTVPDMSGLKAGMMQKVREGGNPEQLTWDQWNYFYAMITGSPGPAYESNPTASANGRGALYGIDQYFSMRGLSGLSGMGAIYGTNFPSLYTERGKGNLYQWNGQLSPEFILWQNKSLRYVS